MRPEQPVVKGSIDNAFDNKLNETQQYISDLCDTIKTILIEKNKRYGNSALDPLKCFSKLPAQDSIKVRLDDKLMRIKNNPNPNPRIDDISDAIGYLILLLVSMKADPQRMLDCID